LFLLYHPLRYLIRIYVDVIALIDILIKLVKNPALMTIQ